MKQGEIKVEANKDILVYAGMFVLILGLAYLATPKYSFIVDELNANCDMNFGGGMVSTTNTTSTTSHIKVDNAGGKFGMNCSYKLNGLSAKASGFINDMGFGKTEDEKKP